METKRNRIGTALQLLTFAAAMLLGGGISGVAKAEPATTNNPPLNVNVTNTPLVVTTQGTTPVTGDVAITNGVNNPVFVTVTSVSPVAETCEGVVSCELYTVPANMVLVVETVSYLVQVGSPCTEPPIPTIHTTPTNPIQLWLPRPSPGTGQFATLYSDVAAVRLYVPAGDTLNFLFNVPSQSCSSTTPVTNATMYGHLMAAPPVE